MSEFELLNQINLQKVYLESMVNDSREALKDEKVYEQSCRLDSLIVEYMRTYYTAKNKCCAS